MRLNVTFTPAQCTVDAAHVAAQYARMLEPAARTEKMPGPVVPSPARVDVTQVRRVADLHVERAADGGHVHLADGRELHLRDIRPDDVDALRRCFARLSREEIRRRFMYAMKELPEPMAQRMCNLDPSCEAALVLMDEGVKPAEMRGVGRIYIDHAIDSAEFSVLVEKRWTGLGLGALLVQGLVDECRRRGLSEVWGSVLMENRPMLELCRHLGFHPRRVADDPGTVTLALDLTV